MDSSSFQSVLFREIILCMEVLDIIKKVQIKNFIP